MQKFNIIKFYYSPKSVETQLINPLLRPSRTYTLLAIHMTVYTFSTREMLNNASKAAISATTVVSETVLSTNTNSHIKPHSNMLGTHGSPNRGMVSFQGRKITETPPKETKSGSSPLIEVKYHTGIASISCDKSECKNVNCADALKKEPNPCGVSSKDHQTGKILTMSPNGTPMIIEFFANLTSDPAPKDVPSKNTTNLSESWNAIGQHKPQSMVRDNSVTPTNKYYFKVTIRCKSFFATKKRA